MKRFFAILVLCILALLMAAPFLSAQSESLSQRFILVAEWGTATAVNDSIFQIDVTFPGDQLGAGYLPTQIQVGWLCLDATGRRYRITAINDAGFADADLNVLELADLDSEPTGVGIVYNPSAEDLIHTVMNGNTTISNTLMSRIFIHNMLVLDSLLTTTGSGVDSFYLDGDTLRLETTTENFAVFIGSSGGSGVDNFYRDGDSLYLAVGVDTFPVSAIEPDSAVYATLTTLADTAAAIRGDFPSGGAANINLDIYRLPAIHQYLPAQGLSANESVTNYEFATVDPTEYKFSTAALGTSSTEYGGWLANGTSGDSIAISAPFGVVIGDSQAEGHPARHGRLHPNGVATFLANYQDTLGTISHALRQLTKMRWFNHGIGGQTTDQVWDRWERDVLGETYNPSDSRGSKTLQRKPSIVIVIAGINDFYVHNRTWQTTAGNLENMARSARDNGISAVFLNCPGDEIITLAQARKVDSLNTWMSSGALQAFGAVVVDYNTWWRDPAYNDNAHGNSLIVDDIHPSTVGYDTLANIIFRAAKLPVVTGIKFTNKLSPAGFSGYSRPANITIQGVAHTISSDEHLVNFATPMSWDSIWVKINSSTNVTGTTYSGFSHIEWLIKNDTTDLYTRKPSLYASYQGNSALSAWAVSGSGVLYNTSGDKLAFGQATANSDIDFSGANGIGLPRVSTANNPPSLNSYHTLFWNIDTTNMMVQTASGIFRRVFHSDGTFPTVNRLVRFITPSTLGNSSVFDNGTNVGIGTASPAYRFEVLGRQVNFGISSIIGISLGNSGNGYPGIGYNVAFQSGTNTYNYRFSDPSYLINFGANNRMAFLVVPAGTGAINYTEAMTITSTGNTGIRTTSPSARLHLPAGTATASTAPLKFTSGTNLTTPEVGAVEFDGSSLFYTITGPTRRRLLDLPTATPTTNHVPYWTGSAWATGAVTSLFTDTNIGNTDLTTSASLRTLTVATNSTLIIRGQGLNSAIRVSDGTAGEQVSLYSSNEVNVQSADTLTVSTDDGNSLIMIPNEGITATTTNGWNLVLDDVNEQLTSNMPEVILGGVRMSSGVAEAGELVSTNGLVQFNEDSPGTNIINLVAPNTFSGDHILTLPTTTGTLAVVGTYPRAEISATATRHYTLSSAATNYTVDTLSSAFLTEFTYSAGVLTYTGTATRRFLINYSLSIATDDSVLLSAGIDKNGAGPLSSTRQAASIGTTTGHAATANISGSGIVGLATSDTVKIVIQSDGAGAPIASVRFASFTLTPID